MHVRKAGNATNTEHFFGLVHGSLAHATESRDEAVIFFNFLLLTDLAGVRG